MTYGPDEQAAESCVAALTAWFQQAPDNREQVDLNVLLDGCDAGSVIEFLFGYCASLLEMLSGETDLHPLKYLNELGTSIQRVIAGLEE